MKDLDYELCNVMYEFVKGHIDEVERKFDRLGNEYTYILYGFKDEDDMLDKINSDVTMAVWALTELLDNRMLVGGIERNYRKELFLLDADWHDYDKDNDCVYRIVDSGESERFFTVNYNTMMPVEVFKKTKKVEVVEWAYDRFDSAFSDRLGGSVPDMCHGDVVRLSDVCQCLSEIVDEDVMVRCGSVIRIFDKNDFVEYFKQQMYGQRKKD